MAVIQSNTVQPVVMPTWWSRFSANAGNLAQGASGLANAYTGWQNAQTGQQAYRAQSLLQAYLQGLDLQQLQTLYQSMNQGPGSPLWNRAGSQLNAPSYVNEAKRRQAAQDLGVEAPPDPNFQNLPPWQPTRQGAMPASQDYQTPIATPTPPVAYDPFSQMMGSFS